MQLESSIAIETHGIDIPHLDQYFGPWAIKEEPFLAAVDRLRTLDLALHMQSPKPAEAAARDRERYGTEGSIAVISLTGPLMKHVSSFSGGTSTVRARRQIREAMADDEISGILLRIDSPGGTAAGTSDLADDVAAAAKQKPVFAQIEDLGASAAYWIASQATKVFATPTSLVGSIGTFTVLYDMQALAAKEGVKVHVIRAGAFKGMGTPGTEITNEQLAEVQRVVDGLNSHFLAGVGRGRKMTAAQVRAIADGRVHIASEALEHGLIDGVQSLDKTFSQLRTSSRGARMDAPISGEPMSQSTPTPASYQDLVTCCPGADEKFICSQLAKSATLDQAQSAWMEEQNRRLEAAQKEAADAKTAAEAANKRPGVDPLGEGKNKADADSDPITTWNDAVAAKVKAGLSQQKAIAAVVRDDPDLHQAYLAAFNDARRPATSR